MPQLQRYLPRIWKSAGVVADRVELGCRVDGFIWVVADDVECIGGQALQAFDPEFVLLPEQVDSFPV